MDEKKRAKKAPAKKAAKKFLKKVEHKGESTKPTLAEKYIDDVQEQDSTDEPLRGMDIMYFSDPTLLHDLGKVSSASFTKITDKQYRAQDTDDEAVDMDDDDVVDVPIFLSDLVSFYFKQRLHKKAISLYKHIRESEEESRIAENTSNERILNDVAIAYSIEKENQSLSQPDLIIDTGSKRLFMDIKSKELESKFAEFINNFSASIEASQKYGQEIEQIKIRTDKALTELEAQWKQ